MDIVTSQFIALQVESRDERTKWLVKWGFSKNISQHAVTLFTVSTFTLYNCVPYMNINILFYLLLATGEQVDEQIDSVKCNDLGEKHCVVN